MTAEVPAALLEAIERVADAVRAPTGEALAEAVREVSRAYTRDRARLTSVASSSRGLGARLRFFLPRDVLKATFPVRELLAAGALPARSTLRILDVGAGLGTTTLGVAVAVRDAGVTDLAVTAVDRDRAALDVFERLAREAPAAGLPRIALRTEAGDAALAASLPGPFDLVVLGLVLNEATGDDARAAAHLLGQLGGALAEDGALVVVEPALHGPTRALMEARDLLAEAGGPLHVFAPCVHGEPCPMRATPRDWCHAALPFRLPDPLAEVARQAGLRYETATFSSLTLRRRPGTARGASCALRAVSAPLPSKGKLELVACGPGGLVQLMRLDRHASDANAALDGLRRGTLVEVQGAHARGTRLRIEAETRVTPHDPG